MPTPQGLYCRPGDFYIDPLRQVPRAVITHGHSDHARPGHEHVLATAATLALMRTRMGAERAGAQQQALAYHEPLAIGDVRVTLVPAGMCSARRRWCWTIRAAALWCRAITSASLTRPPRPSSRCAAICS